MKNFVSLSQVFARYFSENEIQAIKDCVLHGSWGDAEVRFGNDTEDAFGFGYCTNETKRGGHFVGRQVSAIWSSISKKISKNGLRWMVHFNDWWGDGSGDMLFIRCRANDDDHSGPALYELVEKWASGEDPDFPDGFGEKVYEDEAPVEEPLDEPEIKDRWLEDETFVRKYVKSDDLKAEVGVLRAWFNAHGGAQSPEDPTDPKAPKSEWLKVYRQLAMAIRLVLTVHDFNLVPAEEASEAPTPDDAPASAEKTSRGSAHERLARYTEELEAREKGSLTDLEGRPLRKRIASLKRKIARARKSLGMVADNE